MTNMVELSYHCPNDVYVHSNQNEILSSVTVTKNNNQGHKVSHL